MPKGKSFLYPQHIFRTRIRLSPGNKGLHSNVTKVNGKPYTVFFKRIEIIICEVLDFERWPEDYIIDPEV